MSDRIDRAHALRASIHAHVLAHPRCTMAAIHAAHPGENPHTVRRAIQRMRTDGDIAVLGRSGSVCLYTALTAAVRPAATTRARLAEVGRRNQPIATAAWSEKCQAERVTKFVRAERMRAAILAYLNAHPGATTRAVMHALSDGGTETNLMRVSQTMGRMERLGELSCDPRGAVSPVHGRPCSAWTALTDKTVSAEAMTHHVAMNTRKEKRGQPRSMAERLAQEAKAAPKTGPNGGRLYTSGDNPEIQRYRSGGQGAFARPAIGSGMYGGQW